MVVPVEDDGAKWDCGVSTSIIATQAAECRCLADIVIYDANVAPSACVLPNTYMLLVRAGDIHLTSVWAGQEAYVCAYLLKNLARFSIININSSFPVFYRLSDKHTNMYVAMHTCIYVHICMYTYIYIHVCLQFCLRRI